MNSAEQQTIRERANSRKTPIDRGARTKPSISKFEEGNSPNLILEVSPVSQNLKNTSESTENHRKNNLGLYKITSNNTIEIEVPKSSSKKRRSRIGDIELRNNTAFSENSDDKLEFHYAKKPIETNNITASPIFNETLTSRNASKLETNISIKNLITDHLMCRDKENRQSSEVIRDKIFHLNRNDDHQRDCSLTNDEKDGRG